LHFKGIMAFSIQKNLKHLLIDMDGVLTNMELGFLNEWRSKYHELSFIPLEERTTFFPKSQYKARFGQEYEQLINNICYAEGFLLNLPEIVGAFDALKKIDKLGHKITIVTSPLNDPTYSLIEKPIYIEQRLGKEWIKEDRFMIRSDKDNVNGDYLIDDKAEVKRNEQTTWEQILFIRAPYNNNSPIQKRMTWQTNYKKLMDL
jgi:5'(3')-deoxyribonucleotidase